MNADEALQGADASKWPILLAGWRDTERARDEPTPLIRQRLSSMGLPARMAQTTQDDEPLDAA